MSEIKAGDVVQLKSGGVLMTVAWVRGEEALCLWQDAKKPVEQLYATVALKPYVAPSTDWQLA